MHAIKIVGGIVLLVVGIMLAGASALMNWRTVHAEYFLGAGLVLIAAATALILTA